MVAIVPQKNDNLRILAVDVGKETGWWFHPFQSGSSFKVENLRIFYKHIAKIVKNFKPQIILTGYPTRFYNIVKKQSEMIGVLKLIALQNDCFIIELQDAHCKKVVFGNGKMKKEGIMEHYSEDNQNVADARMFIDCYLKEINSGNYIET